MNSVLAAPTLRPIPDSRCEQCKRLGTLAVGIEPLRDVEGVSESFIVCNHCGARTHAAYTNVELEQGAAVVRKIENERERLAAAREFKEKFNAFNAEMLERLK